MPGRIPEASVLQNPWASAAGALPKAAEYAECRTLLPSSCNER